jgi:hypothetical protein
MCLTALGAIAASGTSMNGEQNMKKKSLSMMKSKFVGLPYSLSVAHQIESSGYGFIVSIESGTIRDVFEPGA